MNNLQQLAELCLANSDAIAMMRRTEVMDDAARMALHTIVQELAVKSGITHDSFRRHYLLRFRWWHDHYLQEAEKISPAGAAQLDSRTIEQADVPDVFPSIFDEPPPEQK